MNTNMLLHTTNNKFKYDKSSLRAWAQKSCKYFSHMNYFILQYQLLNIYFRGEVHHTKHLSYTSRFLAKFLGFPFSRVINNCKCSNFSHLLWFTSLLPYSLPALGLVLAITWPKPHMLDLYLLFFPLYSIFFHKT